LSVLPVLNHQTIPVAGTHRLRPGGLDRSHGRQHGMVRSVPGQLGAFPELSTVIASTQRPGAEEYKRAGASAV